MNKWDAAGKLQWLKVRLAGGAQAALQRFSAEDAADYSSVKERLQERFEPSCRKERHRAELQTVRRKKDKGWADLADKLRELPTRVTLIWKKRPKNISLLMSFCHVYVMCNVIDNKALNRPLNPLWRGEALQGAGRVDAYSRSHGTFW